MPRSFLIKKAERVKVDKTFICDEVEEDGDDGYSGYPCGYHGNRVGSLLQSPSPLTKALAPYTPSLPQPLVVSLADDHVHDLSLPTDYTTSRIPSHGVSELEVANIEMCNAEMTVELPKTNDQCNSIVLTSLTSQGPQQPTTVSQSGTEEKSKSESDSLHNFQKGVTVEYTYDAFFITDGRSQKKKVEKEPKKSPIASEKSRAKYSCNECGKQYATSSNLSRHKQTHRSLDSQNAKKCPHCGKVYVSMPALSMHILTHDLRHSCPICDKSFSRPWLLQGHMRSHSGEKPYGCAHCGKAFADRSNLRAHMQTHSSFKHYECKRCNKTFALKSYLNKHFESACFKDSGCDDSPCSPESVSSSPGSV